MEELNYFCSPVYKLYAPEYLDIASKVAEDKIAYAREVGIHDVYPVAMSENFMADPRIGKFTTFVSQLAWDALDSQGYDMSSFITYVGEMWMQEHNKYSSMEQHIHPGYHMVGFYFLETPSEDIKAVIHDPRPAKTMTYLPQKNIRNATHSSDMINFSVRPGDLIMTNAWLPHSFIRNPSNEPFKFIHFNIFAQQRQCEVV